MDSLDLYIKEINRYKLLSREDEIRLAKRVQKGDLLARQEMVNSNLRFVVKMAHQYAGYGLQLSDLIQEGNIGLMKAVKRFDPKRGYRLITYAAWWIRAYIQKFVAYSWSLVKISNVTLFFSLRSKRNNMTTANNEPSVSEMAKALSTSDHNIEEMDLRIAKRDFSVDIEIQNGTSQTHLDVMSSDSVLQDEAYVIEERDRKVRMEVWKLMQGYSERERYIIMHRLMNNEPKTLQDIGSKLSISRERARQIECNVIRKLRKAFEITDLRPAA